MTTFANVSGVNSKLRLGYYPSIINPDFYINQPMAVDTSNPQVVAWSTKDNTTLNMSPYYDRNCVRNYWVYFTTPNDGITHNYTFNGYFKIPAGYLAQTQWSYLGGPLGIEDYYSGDWRPVNNILNPPVPYWRTTPVNLATDMPLGNVLALPPNTQWRVSWNLTYAWYPVAGTSDSCPLDTGFSVYCPDFSSGIITHNQCVMIPEQPL